MNVEFDPAKDEANIAKHGVSLKRAEDFDFDAAFYDIDDSQNYGETRYNAIGWLGTLLHTLTFTQKGTPFAPSASARRPDRRQEHYAEEY